MSEWQNRVERSHQLDEAAQILCATWWEKRYSMGPLPDWLILASPSASNWTDAHFVRSEMPSPSKFVHTLPNVRGAALLQLMNWHGPVLCIQNDPHTVHTALLEATMLAVSEKARVWVASSWLEGASWRAEFYVAEGMEITKK